MIAAFVMRRTVGTPVTGVLVAEQPSLMTMAEACRTLRRIVACNPKYLLSQFHSLLAIIPTGHLGTSSTRSMPTTSDTIMDKRAKGLTGQNGAV